MQHIASLEPVEKAYAMDSEKKIRKK